MCCFIRTSLTCLLLISLVDIGYGIKCWDCRSDLDPKCKDPFDNTTLAITDCNTIPSPEHLPYAKPTICRKIRQKVHGVWRYIRSCAFLGEPGLGGDERFCLMRTGTYNIFMEYCTCNTKDGCNSSSFVKPSFALVLSIIAFQYSRWALNR